MSSLSITTPNATQLRDLRPLDWPEVARIYEDGIATGVASFEQGAPTWEEWSAAHRWLEATTAEPSSPGQATGTPSAPLEIRLVAELAGRIAGWCALSPTSSRRCYRGVAEESVYVAEWAQGRGIGRTLLEAVIARSEAAGIWTLQAGIFPENKPSLRLHLGCGFRLVGVRERVGEADGIWRDVLLLERRSEVIGA